MGLCARMKDICKMSNITAPCCGLRIALISYHRSNLFMFSGGWNSPVFLRHTRHSCQNRSCSLTTMLCSSCISDVTCLRKVPSPGALANSVGSIDQVWHLHHLFLSLEANLIYSAGARHRLPLGFKQALERGVVKWWIERGLKPVSKHDHSPT